MKRVCFLLSLAVLTMTFLLVSLPAQAASSLQAHATLTDPTQNQSFKIRGYDPYPYYYGYVTVGFNSNNDVGITGGDPNTVYYVVYNFSLNWHYMSSGTQTVDSDGDSKTVQCDVNGNWSASPHNNGGSLFGAYSFYQTGSYTAKAVSSITNTVSGESQNGVDEHTFVVTN